jgi:hypothetical protein
MRRERPLLAVRLIGPTAVVTAYKNHLINHFARELGQQATCRTSTHPAQHTNEIRVYLTIHRKEATP